MIYHWYLFPIDWFYVWLSVVCLYSFCEFYTVINNNNATSLEQLLVFRIVFWLLYNNLRYLCEPLVKGCKHSAQDSIYNLNSITTEIEEQVT